MPTTSQSAADSDDQDIAVGSRRFEKCQYGCGMSHLDTPKARRRHWLLFHKKRHICDTCHQEWISTKEYTAHLKIHPILKIIEDQKPKQMSFRGMWNASSLH